MEPFERAKCRWKLALKLVKERITKQKLSYITFSEEDELNDEERGLSFGIKQIEALKNKKAQKNLLESTK